MLWTLVPNGIRFSGSELPTLMSEPAPATITAHPTLVGKSLRDLKDKTGKPLGEEIYKVAAEGKISEVSYMWPRPGTTEPGGLCLATQCSCRRA